MKKAMIMAALAMVAAVQTVQASITDELLAVRRARTKSVLPGIWHADLAKARAYAEANGMPLIAVWSNGDQCGHCQTFEQVAMSPLFRQWMATTKYVWYFGVCNDGASWTAPSADGQEGYHGSSFYWCRKREGSYDPYASQTWPYFRIYWRKKSGLLKVDNFYSGSTLDGEGYAKMPAGDYVQTDPGGWVFDTDRGTYNAGARYFIQQVTGIRYGRTLNEIDEKGTGILSAYVPASDITYYGGAFDVADGVKYPHARMEIEYGTAVTNLVVPLARTNTTAQANVATNYLEATYPSGKVKTDVVAWAKKQSSALADVKIATGWLGNSDYQSPTNRIRLVLMNEKKVPVATNYIFCVKPVANSPANPLWLKERKPDALRWGEWTMDIDAATNKVDAARKGGDAKAYTLILVGGPLWCPDCENLEKYLINTAAFAAWATNTHHVACVAIDEPAFSSGASVPTLLSHQMATSYLTWPTLYQVSGSGYLTRKGIAPAEAARCLARNLSYVNNDTRHGGLCLPENASSAESKTGKWKTGIPALILMRADGTVAGRIYQFSNSTDALGKDSAATLVKRLDELIAQDSDRGEEDNDSWHATGSSIGVRARQTATLSFTDGADYYRIDAKKGTDVLFVLGTNDVASKDARLTLSVIDATRTAKKDGKTVNVSDSQPVTAYTNTLANGLSVAATLPSDNCYVRVGYPADGYGFPTDPFFALDKKTSTLCAYALESSGIFEASEVMATTTIDDGNPEVTIYLSKGQVYAFTGIDASNPDNLALIEKEIAVGGWTGRWVSKVTTAATLVLHDDGTGLRFGYQRWVPGVVGFERTTLSMAEPEKDVDVTVNIRRTGGLSGWAKATLSLDRANSTSIDDGSVYEWADDGRTLVWGEGTNDTLTTVIRVKRNELSDGDQKVTLKLTRADDGDATIAGDYASYVLTIRDDDEPVPGVLSIRAVNGMELPASRRLFVKGGTDITVVAQRADGAAGDIVGRLSATTGAVCWAESHTWASRTVDPHAFGFTLPGYASVPNHRVVVRLTGVDGAQVDASASYLVLELTPESAPAFTVPGVLSATRNVNAGTYEIPVDWTSVNIVGGAITAAKTEGCLPPGISWSFDDSYEEHSFNVGRIVLRGTPTAAGVYTACFRATQDGLTGPSCAVTINVTDPSAMDEDESPEANPSVAQTRTFSDVFVIDTNGAERVVGLVTLTIPASGRLSARYRKLDGTSVALLSESWASCVGGNYGALLQSVTEPGYGLAVLSRTTGQVEAALTDPDCGTPLVCVIPERNWSKQNPATAWKGYYTVSMPNENPSALACGDAYVTLRMETDAAVSAGRVTYAGMLPNGKSFSGVSTLFEGGLLDEAVLPVFRTSSTDSFAALYVLDPQEDENQKVWTYNCEGLDVKPVWHHVGAGGASYVTTFNVFGCLYREEDLVECCTNKFGRQILTFFASTNLTAAAGFSRNVADAWVTNSVGVSVRSRYDGGKFVKSYLELVDPVGAEAENGLTLGWSRGTGIVSGTLRFDFRDGPSVTARYRGVMMPGWGTLDCSSCSDVRCDKRPFISGSCWFSDTFTIGGGGGTSTEIRGVPFSIGVYEGK